MVAGKLPTLTTPHRFFVDGINLLLTSLWEEESGYIASDILRVGPTG